MVVINLQKVSSLIVNDIVALNQVINILRARKIQKLIANGDSTIIICKIRDLTPYAP